MRIRDVRLRPRLDRLVHLPLAREHVAAHDHPADRLGAVDALREAVDDVRIHLLGRNPGDVRHLGGQEMLRTDKRLRRIVLEGRKDVLARAHVVREQLRRRTAPGLGRLHGHERVALREELEHGVHLQDVRIAAPRQQPVPLARHPEVRIVAREALQNRLEPSRRHLLDVERAGKDALRVEPRRQRGPIQVRRHLPREDDVVDGVRRRRLRRRAPELHGCENRRIPLGLRVRQVDADGFGTFHHRHVRADRPDRLELGQVTRRRQRGRTRLGRHLDRHRLRGRRCRQGGDRERAREEQRRQRLHGTGQGRTDRGRAARHHAGPPRDRRLGPFAQTAVALREPADDRLRQLRLVLRLHDALALLQVAHHRTEVLRVRTDRSRLAAQARLDHVLAPVLAQRLADEHAVRNTVKAHQLACRVRQEDGGTGRALRRLAP